jgi:hypothetical protein
VAKDEKPKVVPPGGSIAVSGSAGYYYDRESGRLYKVTQSGTETVLSWLPKVTEYLVARSDGRRVTNRWYTVCVGGYEAVCSWDDLASGEVWKRFPDATGIAQKAIRDVLFNIIQAEAKDLTLSLVVERTGWHFTDDGKPAYVHADGSMYPPDAGLRIVGIPEPLEEAATRSFVEPADDTAVQEALLSLNENAGSPPLIALGAGIRALGSSFFPARTSLVIVADMNLGKTGTVAVGRMPLYYSKWPPVTSATFEDTITSIEYAVAREADALNFLDDLALVAGASDQEVREANEKLERVLRAAHNATAMRNRMTKELTARPGNFVRGIPVVTAQQFPSSVQPSLLRRIVILFLRRGDVHISWLEKHAEDLAVPLRTLGDRVITALHAAGSNGARELLEQADRDAALMFAAHLDVMMPDRDALARGVERQSAMLLSGLLVAADVAGVDRGQLASPAVEYLAEALAAQMRFIKDRTIVTDEDLTSSIGEIVREALFNNQAHVRDRDDGINPYLIPGRTHQELGVWSFGKDDSKNWQGKGPALYFLSGHGPALGIRSEHLLMLVQNDRRKRIRGRHRDSLLADLLKDGALIPSTQKGTAATPRIDIGGKKLRLALLRAEVVYPDLGHPDSGADDHVEEASEGGTIGTTGTSGTAQLRAPFDDPDMSDAAQGDDALTSKVPEVPVVPMVPGGGVGSHADSAVELGQGEDPAPVEPVSDRWSGGKPAWRCNTCGEIAIALSNLNGRPHMYWKKSSKCNGRFRPANEAAGRLARGEEI